MCLVLWVISIFVLFSVRGHPKDLLFISLLSVLYVLSPKENKSSFFFFYCFFIYEFPGFYTWVTTSFYLEAGHACCNQGNEGRVVISHPGQTSIRSSQITSKKVVFYQPLFFFTRNYKV